MSTRVTRWLAAIEERDLLWLAGLLEGEGSFGKASPSMPGSPRVVVSMTDEDVIQRVATLWGMTVFRHHRGKEKGWKPTCITRLSGGKAVALMKRLRPLMGQRRQAQIDAAIATWCGPKKVKISLEQGAEITVRFREGEKAVDLAAEYGVTKWSIYAIHQGRYFGK